jgi:hypothetical protein
VVTHLTTSPPVEGLTYGERTGPGGTPSPVVVCEGYGGLNAYTCGRIDVDSAEKETRI